MKNSQKVWRFNQNTSFHFIDLPENYDKEEFARIQKAAAKIQSNSEVL